jgi:hypothetical protein
MSSLIRDPLMPLRNILKSKTCKFLCVPIVLLYVLLSASVAVASPVQVFECDIFLPQSPLPIDHLDLRFTIRRHIEHTEPVELLETDLWSRAKYENNGYFEVTVYPLEGEPRVERSTSVLTTVLDGNEVIGDEYSDEALTMDKIIEYEGYTLDSAAIILKKDDGSAINSFAPPDEFDLSAWDPQSCDSGEGGSGRCDIQCYVRWLAPPPGLICSSGLCTTGIYLGTLGSVSYEPHEVDHDESNFVINSGLNDAWVNTNAPFQGMFITVFPVLKLVFVAWFTFDSEQPPEDLTAIFGAPDQRWVTALGSYDGNRAEMKAELTIGGSFNASSPLPTQDTNYGTINIEFANCEEGLVEFDFPSTGEVGSYNIQRVVNTNVALCEALNSD